MKTIKLNIHGIIKIKIVNPSGGILEDINMPYSYFRVEEEMCPDIEIRIGGFSEDTEGCSAVDHKYFVKKDYIYFRDTAGPLSWRAQLCGLEEGRYRLDVSYGFVNRMIMPNNLYPDQILYNFILYPLLEQCFLRKGYLFLHAGAVADGERGIIFAGRGSSYKTSIIMDLVRNGFYSLGDGWVIVKGDQLYSFPTCVSFFDYRKRFMPEENLSLYDRFRVIKFLTKKTPSNRDWIKDRARLKKLVITYREDRDKVEIEEITNKTEVADILLANNRLEWKANYPYGGDTRRFLDAYEYVYPESPASSCEDTFRQGILNSIENAHIYKARIPLKWQRGTADTIGKIIKGE